MSDDAPPKAIDRLRLTLRYLYHGQSPAAVRFQLAVLTVDLAIIVLFILTPILRDDPSFLWIDYSIALLLGIDLVARGLAARDTWRWLRQPVVWVDLFIFATLLAPAWFINLGFLRVLRLWTLSRSPVLWRSLRKKGLARYEERIGALVNLLVFLFIVTGFIYTAFARRGAGIDGYLDALYFTVTTVTTTGYGDVILPGPWGRLTSIVVMIVGISLFVRLAQAIVRPQKVNFPCPQCGLSRHDLDAVHCKACGHLLNIPNDGE